MSGQWINSPTWPVQLSWECHGPWGVRCQPGWCLAFFVVQQWHWRSINSAFQQDVARLYERAAVFLQSLFDIEIELSKIFWKSSKMFTFWEECELRCSSLTWQHGVYTTAKSHEMIAHLKLALRENRLQLRVPKMNSSMNSSIRWRQQDMLLMALFFSICFVFKCSCISMYFQSTPGVTITNFWMITVWWFLKLVVSRYHHGLKPSPWTMGTMGPRKTCVCFGYYRPYIYGG